MSALERSPESAAPAVSFRALFEGLAVSAVVTACVSVVSVPGLLPDRYVATLVGFLFLGAVWLLVWRGDDTHVERFGLSLGGLVLPGRLDVRALARHALVALGWAALFAAITFVPFFFGWRAFWHPRGPFAWKLEPWSLLNDVFGQIVIIALPEEAFYRGYLQSRLDEALPFRVSIFGAKIGPSLVLTSAIFALGHLATIHSPMRLAVFFPSLLFGWLRARTGGIGASVAFHAACNVFREVLTSGYRL